MMRTLNEVPFEARGNVGAFALGLLKEASGDKERATWMVYAKLGIVPETLTPKQWQQQPRNMAKYHRLSGAFRIAEEAAALWPMAIAACGMRREREEWVRRVDAAWGDPLERMRTVYFGDLYCRNRFDLTLHDRARELGRGDFLRVSSSFDLMLSTLRPTFGQVSASTLALRAGEFAIRSADVLGDDAWLVIERMLDMGAS